jgi:hypothetical protein
MQGQLATHSSFGLSAIPKNVEENEHEYARARFPFSGDIRGSGNDGARPGASD